MQRFSLKPLAFLGKYSYEIYLTHGYLFNLMHSVAMLPIFILSVGTVSGIVHCGMKIMRKLINQ